MFIGWLKMIDLCCHPTAAWHRTKNYCPWNWNWNNQKKWKIQNPFGHCKVRWELWAYLDASLSFIFELAGERFFDGMLLFTKLMYSSFKLLKIIETQNYSFIPAMKQPQLKTHNFWMFSLSSTNFSYCCCVLMNFRISLRLRLMTSFL